MNKELRQRINAAFRLEYSIKDVAAQLGIDQNALSQWFSGDINSARIEKAMIKNFPNLISIEELCDSIVFKKDIKKVINIEHEQNAEYHLEQRKKIRENLIPLKCNSISVKLRSTYQQFYLWYTVYAFRPDIEARIIDNLSNYIDADYLALMKDDKARYEV